MRPQTQNQTKKGEKENMAAFFGKIFTAETEEWQCKLFSVKRSLKRKNQHATNQIICGSNCY